MKGGQEKNSGGGEVKSRRDDDRSTDKQNVTMTDVRGKSIDYGDNLQLLTPASICQFTSSFLCCLTCSLLCTNQPTVI